MKTSIFLPISIIFTLFVGCASTESPSTTPTVSPTVVLELTQFGVTAAGTAVSIAVVELVDPSNKSGTANDILTIDAALLTLLNGTIPTATQIDTVMASFKSNASTTNYANIAQQVSSALQSQLSTWEKSGATATEITQYATWFISGTQLGAAALSK